jgi:6,7-dimethyl-8-ribityllumazine synthase
LVSRRSKTTEQKMRAKPLILIIEARFYEDLADELARGAIAALEAAGAEYERIAVPGALEIPGALAMVLRGPKTYDAYVALGCVIRGETTHYDIVAGESARLLGEIAVLEGIAVGNGILTVENDEQAWARARVSEMDKGGGAAKAALAMMELRRKMGLAE